MGLACLFGHKWNGCKCERCGLSRENSYEYAALLMDEKKYYDAFKCFERAEKSSGGSFEDKKKECFDLAYKSASDAIACNDYTYFQDLTLFGYGIDEMEDALIDIELRRKIKNYIQIGRHRHPLMDKLKEQICSAITESIEKKDYQSVERWLQSLGKNWESICKTYIRDSDTLNQLIFWSAQQCIDEKEYMKALKWLRDLPKDYPNRAVKMEECEKEWQYDSRNPYFCPHSPDGKHQWESVPGSEETIDSEIRKIGYHMSRCRYCGKTEKVIDYDYDTDGY